MTLEAERDELGVSTWHSAGPAERHRRRRLLLAVTVAFTVFSAFVGFATGREAVLGWVLLFLWAACAGDTRRWWRAVVRDWSPLIGVLIAYDLLRGLAKYVGPHLAHLPTLFNGKASGDPLDQAHVTEMIAGDRALFAGHVPTLWLQQHLYDPAVTHWYDVLVVITYMTHFMASLVVAVVLWARSYAVFRRYVWTLVTLTVATLATYALYPAAPPWMASINNYLPQGVVRVVGETLLKTGGHTVNSAVERGSTYANSVAAIPSLHSAVPMMMLLFFWPLVTRRVRVALVTYVVVMTFSLVYGGEHYVTDVLLGWGFAAASVLVVRRLARPSATP